MKEIIEQILELDISIIRLVVNTEQDPEDWWGKYAKELESISLIAAAKIYAAQGDFRKARTLLASQSNKREIFDLLHRLQRDQDSLAKYNLTAIQVSAYLREHGVLPAECPSHIHC